MAVRPSIRKPAPPGGPRDPEELFYGLSGRAKTHAYLRGPQQDALREYLKCEQEKDIAFELPTGAGKTTVGLLIAEWHRRRNKGRAAYLTLTNQLAAQVITEARNLTIAVADLRGNKERRSRIEEGKFLEGSAVGISTYSNLFNINPIINQCDVLVLDDAHGGGDFAASMWTLRISKEEYPDIFSGLSATLGPLMTETQQAELADSLVQNRIVLVDLGLSTSAQDQVVQIIDGLSPDASERYPWSLVRGRLRACHVFVSRDSVVIRPYISPTFAHEPFAQSGRRIFMTATLGDLEDLRRAYAIDKVNDIRVAHKQDGRRFVFVPGLVLGDDQTYEAIRTIWRRLDPRRAVVIAPSFVILNQLMTNIRECLGDSRISFLGARDIEESLSPFTDSLNSILGLANRYDGLDLPDDDCRLLVLGGSPRATNELEANLSAAWKLGPALRWREATRLVQGMGRCTRNATDFAIICLLGQSLINVTTNPAFLKLLPATLQAEIQWGKEQIEELKHDPSSFAEMVLGLICDDKYRSEADQAISEIGQHTGLPVSGRSIAGKEVKYARAIWEGDFSGAQEIAHEIVDHLSGEEWAGYRCWWLYLAARSARFSGSSSTEIDALRRAKAIGINSGWLDHLIRSREGDVKKGASSEESISSAVIERIWMALEELGWSGKRFLDYSEEMLRNLEMPKNVKAFHRGLAQLGRLLGAHSIVPNQQGDPDVVWRFADHIWICFEAKTEKKQDGQGLSKKDLLEARGHVDWVRFFETQGKRNVQILATIISPTDKLQRIALPHRGSLFLLKTHSVVKWGKVAHEGMLRLRSKFVGQEFSACRAAFATEVSRLGLDLGATISEVKGTPL